MSSITTLPGILKIRSVQSENNHKASYPPFVPFLLFLESDKKGREVSSSKSPHAKKKFLEYPLDVVTDFHGWAANGTAYVPENRETVKRMENDQLAKNAQHVKRRENLKTNWKMKTKRGPTYFLYEGFR